MNNLALLIVDKTSSMDVGTGAIYSIVAILMVFAILLLIIGIMELVFKATGLLSLKKELEQKEAKMNQANVQPVQNQVSKEVVIKDDDMMAACLIATIDYRNEIKKDVRVVSIKEL